MAEMACDPSGTVWLFASAHKHYCESIAEQMGLKPMHVHFIGSDPDRLRGMEGVYRHPLSRYRLVIVPSHEWWPDEHYMQFCKAMGFR